MKARTKLISSILTPAAILPLVGFATTSCGRKKTIIDTLYNSMISEFFELCKIPRPTYHTFRFVAWLADHVYDIFDGDKDFKGVRFDWGYTPFEHTEDYGTNLYFDIPASSLEYQDYPTIILQCHTDMVWQTVTGEDVPDIPVPVMEKRNGQMVIHTDGYKTSLGADNGAGIAICLALAKNYKNFNHGPIRVLMTTDEEDGPSGAIHVPNDWLSGNCKFLANLDLEESMRVCQSTAGVQQMAWTRDFNAVTNQDGIYENGYTILISGLQGGHSAKAITKKRANSIKLGTYILKRFLNDTEFKSTPLQLCSVREMPESVGPNLNEEEHVCPTTPGSIPKYLKLVFATNYSFASTPDAKKFAFQKWLDDVVNDWKEETATKYKEDNLRVLGDVVDNPKKNPAVLSAEDSEKIINFVDDLKFQYSGETSTGCPITSYNIGGFRINDGDYSVPKTPNEGEQVVLPVYAEVFARSVDKDDLGAENQPENPDQWEGMRKIYRDIEKEYWPEAGKTSWKSVGWNPIWEADDGDVLTKILIAGGKDAGYDPKAIDEHSWLEIGAFAQKNPTLDIAAIGPTIDDVHSVREVFYVETAKPMFAMLLFAFQHLKDELGGDNE